jgi:VWFA-related protein
MVHDRSTRLVEPFTDDRETLAAALDGMEAVATSAITLDSERTQALDSVQEAYLTYFTRGADPEVACRVSAGWGAMENAARAYAAAIQTHVGGSATAVATAAHYLAGLPGHRVLLYVGGGLPQTAGIEVFQLMGDVCPSRISELSVFHLDYDLTWLYQEVADRATADGVTLYALEASSPALDLGFDSGHTGGAVTSGSPLRAGHLAGTGRGEAGYEPTFRPSVAGQRQRSVDEEGSLVLLARQTGGRAFLNSVEIADDLARIAGELRTYYSLGFRPLGPGDGGLHRIEARVVGHEGYRIRYRQAYRDKAPEQRMAERVMAVAQFGAGANPLDVRMEVGTPLPEDSTARVPVRIWVPLTALTLVPGAEAGELQGRLQVLMAATGGGGTLGPVRQKLIEVSVHPGEAGVAGDQLVEVGLEAPPGRNYVALAVRDDLGGAVSYLRRGFWVPTGGLVAMSLGD